MGVNCAGGDEVVGEDDNGDYYEEEQDNSDYQWGHPESQVGFAENGDSSPLIDLEFDDIGRWNTYSGAGSYLANRSATGEYRDAGRAADCDVFKTLAEANITRWENGKRSGRYGDLERA